MDNLQDILYQFGLYRSRRIYWYIYTTVELAYQSPHLLEELTRDLYPAAALRCGCSSAAIERGIRAAIARAWDVNPALFSQLACRKSHSLPLLGISSVSSANTLPKQQRKNKTGCQRQPVQNVCLSPAHVPSVSGHTRAEVIVMKYPDMHALLSQEPEARAYFDALPDYVREQMQTRSQGVNSLESLKDYAENLLRGDD